ETIRERRTLLTEVSTAIPGDSPVDIETDPSGTRVDLPDPTWIKPVLVIIGLHAFYFVIVGLNVFFFLPIAL
ncbi:MAG: hypothetical protein ABEN55_05600, partial [Bradymonadaceae bacterium]